MGAQQRKKENLFESRQNVVGASYFLLAAKVTV
jgi:hypothetical protein